MLKSEGALARRKISMRQEDLCVGAGRGVILMCFYGLLAVEANLHFKGCRNNEFKATLRLIRFNNLFVTT